jgi:hypothetical protein
MSAATDVAGFLRNSIGTRYQRRRPDLGRNRQIVLINCRNVVSTFTTPGILFDLLRFI